MSFVSLNGNEAFSANRGGMPPLAEPDARTHARRARAAPAAARLAAALAGASGDGDGPAAGRNHWDAGGVDAPLIDQLRAGDFEAADQTSCDLLIEIAGADATKRGYVYWTEARTSSRRLGAVTCGCTTATASSGTLCRKTSGAARRASSTVSATRSVGLPRTRSLVKRASAAGSVSPSFFTHYRKRRRATSH